MLLPKPRPRAALMFGAVVALLVWVIAGQNLMAALYANQAQAFLDDWKSSAKQDHTFVPSSRAWRVANFAAHESVAWGVLARGDDLERQGRIQVWGKTDDWPTRRDRLHAALDSYRQSIGARPLWPWAWLRLANTKYRLGERDAEFHNALQQTEFLAGTRMSVLPALSEIGLRAWDELDTPTRQAIVRAVQKTVEDSTAQARRLERRAKDIGEHRLFCALIPLNLQQQRKLCESPK
jgi:hypothetical protein